MDRRSFFYKGMLDFKVISGKVDHTAVIKREVNWSVSLLKIKNNRRAGFAFDNISAFSAHAFHSARSYLRSTCLSFVSTVSNFPISKLIFHHVASRLDTIISFELTSY
jgi:hypothetical protein